MANGVIGRRDYDKKLFVGRTEQIRRAKDWITTGKGKFLPLVGSPGSGKSWFLRALEDEVANGIVTLRLKVPVSNPRIENNDWDEQKVEEWVRGQIDNLQQKKTNCRFPEWDNLVEFPQMINLIAEAMCQCNANETILFFIDGLDALSNDAWRKFESQVITVFARHDCFRFVLAFRRDQRLNAVYLRLNSAKPLQLPTLSEEEGKEQIEKLRGSASDMQTYGLSHPQINDFIVQHQGTWTEETVPDVLSTLRPFRPGLFDKLKQAIHLFEPSGFSVTDVQGKLRISKTEAWAWIDDLRQNDWVRYDDQNGTYEVIDGLRQFLLTAKEKALL